MAGTFTPTPGHQHFLAGFDNAADCSLSFGGTRTVTITPVGSTFRVWANGQKFDKTTTTKQISTDQGLHFVYFDTSGVIQESHTTPWSITGLGAPICTVYWDGTNGALCDERHSAYRDRYWHKWAHNTVGTRWLSGFVPTINANCTFSLSTGVVADEDLQFSTGGAKTACTQWHRNATGWLLEANKTVLYHGTSGAPEYDSAGTMTAVDNNKYFNSYLYATGDVSYPIYCVIGQAQHNTLAGATGEAIPSFTSAQFVAEMKLLYRVTMQLSGGAATYVQYQDYRTSSTLPAGQATATQAAQVTFSPSGNVASTNVQAAIEELDAEKSATSHTHDGLLTAAQATDLTDGGETTLHSHAAGAPGHADVLVLNEQSSAPSTLAGHGQVYDKKTVTNVYGYDSYTKLMLHCNGTDASTTVTDETGKTVSCAGTAQLDTAQKKFGTASLLLDGNSDYVSLSDSDDWYFGTGKFTVDFWVRWNSVGTALLIGQIGGAGDRAWYILKESGIIRFYSYISSSWGIILNATWNPSTGQWYHVAVVRNGTGDSDWMIFIDGVKQATSIVAGSAGVTLPNTSDGLVIGYSSIYSGSYFNGWMDEIRVSKGVARWTSDFTAPTEEYAQSLLSSTTTYDHCWMDETGVEHILHTVTY